MRLLVRYRRDLVKKCTASACQIREHLHLALPGYAALFENFWVHPLPMTIARCVTSPAEVRRLGRAGLAALLHKQAIRCFIATSLAKIVAWAERAAEPDPDAALHRRIVGELDDDRIAKTGQLQAPERDIVARLVATPFILLLGTEKERGKGSSVLLLGHADPNYIIHQTKKTPDPFSVTV